MEPKTILLNQAHYLDYLNGQEVECLADQLRNSNISPGEHVMVYKNTVASVSDVGVPTREKQSDYIGVEGTVTQVNVLQNPSQSNNTRLQSIKVKKL